MRTIRVQPDHFQGAIACETTQAGALRPWRVPLEGRSLFPSPDDLLVRRAGFPSGVRLRFATTSRTVRVNLMDAGDEDVSDAERYLIDITDDGCLLASSQIADGVFAWSDSKQVSGRTSTGTPEETAIRERVYEIWLDQFHPVAVQSIEVDTNATFRVPQDERPRWITYGSSITACRDAFSPARTWPAIAARMCKLHLLNLGYGGQCHLDQMVSRVIAERSVDVVTLEVGINIYGSSSLNARTYPAALIGFVQTIREAHPEVPLGVITAIPSPDRENAPNSVGCTLEDYRVMTRESVRRLQEAGHRELYLFEGNTLLHSDEEHLLFDGLHPDGEGYELMGLRVAEHVIPILLAARP